MPELSRYSIGDWTYGKPTVWTWHPSESLTIGRYCSIAHGTTIMLGGEHHAEWITTFPFGELWKLPMPCARQATSKGGVSIGNDVWIAHNALILSGVTIGNGAIIGAGAVVTKDVPAYAIAAGNPARVIRYRFSPETIEQLEALAWWDWPHERVLEAVPHLLSDPSSFFALGRPRANMR